MATRLLSYAKKSAVTFAVTTTTPSIRSYYPSRTAVQIPDPPLLSRVCPSGTSPPVQVQCVCGDEASGKSTVECVSCSSWSHIQCARLTLRTAKQSRFLCHKCRPATGKRAGAAGGKKCQGDTAHLLAPPRPSLQSSSNELPAPATSPPTCSSTPAQYSPLSPHQPSPPPPPQPSPPPPSQPPSTEHSQPTSSPSSNPSPSPPQPSVETSPQVAIEIDTEIEDLLPQSASAPNNSPNIPDVHRLPQHSRIAPPAATTTTASNHPMPTPPTCHSAPSLCSLLLQPPFSQCTQYPNPYSSTCTPASEAIAHVTSRTMLNSTPANQSRNTTRLVSIYNTPIVCYASTHRPVSSAPTTTMQPPTTRATPMRSPANGPETTAEHTLRTEFNARFLSLYRRGSITTVNYSEDAVRKATENGCTVITPPFRELDFSPDPPTYNRTASTDLPMYICTAASTLPSSPQPTHSSCKSP